jgi:hypothetical protein
MTISAWSGKSREMRLNKGTSRRGPVLGATASHQLFSRCPLGAEFSQLRATGRIENFKNEY